MGYTEITGFGSLDFREVPTPLSVVYSTTGDHTAVAAPGAGLCLVFDDLQIQAQGASDQDVSIKAGATIHRGPYVCKSKNVISVGVLGGFRLPENQALVINNSVAENLLVTGGYRIRAVGR